MIRFLIASSFLVFLATFGVSQSGMLAYRKAQIQAVLAMDQPVIRIPTQDEQLITAQNVFLQDTRVSQYFFDEEGKPMLNEVFSVYKAIPSDLPVEIRRDSGDYFKVELYNYALNFSAIGIVEIRKQTLVNVNIFHGIQPDLPESLARLAVEIAVNDSLVIQHFGSRPNPFGARMQATKTALNRTKCQRSKHLCVAPTFVKEDKALWAIVDLHDLKVVGVKWTSVGVTGMPVTERSLQNEEIMSCFCDVENKVDRDGWQFSYTLSRSDGLVVSDVKFKGVDLYKSVKTVDWHVSYSGTEGFGYSDAIGCPEFSMSAVVAVEPPHFMPIEFAGEVIGFALIQKYFSEGWPTPCSYNYQQQFEFYLDGSFRPVIGSLGRGCGIDATYRPITRIAFAGDALDFYTLDAGEWQNRKNEFWMLEGQNVNTENQLAQIKTNGNSFLVMESNRGQFNDGGRGDNAYIYVTKHHNDIDEGDTDMPSLGTCCNIDHRQGPEMFINDENIASASFVLWYVPQIKNDNRKGYEYCWAESVLVDGKYEAIVYPCLSGPKFLLTRE